MASGVAVKVKAGTTPRRRGRCLSPSSRMQSIGPVRASDCELGTRKCRELLLKSCTSGPMK